VNNRDLRDFSVDLHHTIYLKQRMPQETVVVGESAIFTREDALLLQEAGVKAMLVGESLLRQENLASAVTELIGC